MKLSAGGAKLKARIRETIMADSIRRSRLIREMEQGFVPDYEAAILPSPDKRATYALEHIAFNVGRIEQKLAQLAAALAALGGKT
jgi:hypothetical protein